MAPPSPDTPGFLARALAAATGLVRGGGARGAGDRGPATGPDQPDPLPAAGGMLVLERARIARAMLESDAEGLVVADGDGCVRAVNPMAEKIFGFAAMHVPLAEWPARLGIFLEDATTVCPPDAWPAQRAHGGESVTNFEVFVRNERVPDGVWLGLSAHPLRDDDGPVRGAILVLRDITARKRVERALDEERRQLRRQHRRRSALAAVELAVDQPDEAQRVLGQIAELVREALPAPFAAVLLFQDETSTFTCAAPHPLADPDRAVIARFRADGSGAHWAHRESRVLSVTNVRDEPFGAGADLQALGIGAYVCVPLIDGHEVHGVLLVVEHAAREFAQEELEFLRGIAGRGAAALGRVRLYERLRGLNERLRRRTVELHENEQRFRSLADTAPVFIWMAAPDAGCTYFNRTWLDFTGRSLESQLGEGWTACVHPDDRAAMLASYRSAFRARQRFTLEYRLRRDDDAYRWLLVTGAPRFGPGDEFLGYIGSCVDISDRKAAEAELSHHREQLEELVRERTAELEKTHERLRAADRLASIGTLTAGLGHDINNVLFPIRCRLDALDMETVPPELRDTLQAMSHTSEYLQQLSDGLRLFARDPEEPGATAEATDLIGWWEQISSLLTKTLPREVALDVDLPEDLPPLRVAPHRLTQAVLNLVVNAGEAMPGGGTVRVRAAAAADGAWVRVSVSDDGQGMSPEVRRRAFDPFFTTKKRRLSTGLGLSLVHGVVQASGGRAEIETRPGRGTTVTLSFAVVPTATVEPTRRSPRTLGTACVTVQNSRLFAWTSRMLEAAGYAVVNGGGPPPPDAAVWITDASDANADDAERFLAARPGRRVIAVGPLPGRWMQVDAVHVRGGADLEALRAAIGEVAVATEGAST